LRKWETCPDCGVAVGRLHRDGCDVETCPLCGRQALGCGCPEAKFRAARRMPFSGEWPGARECRDLGWYSRMVPGQGRVPCGPDDEDATEDLNRLARSTRWDARTQTRVPI
jgi:hypothetical protein